MRIKTKQDSDILRRDGILSAALLDQIEDYLEGNELKFEPTIESIFLS